MKVLGLVLPALFLLTTPAVAVEYQGQNIDGKVLNAKAYYYATGGVYDVQVRFDKRRAIIYFSDGNQAIIQLHQKVITDSKVIEGFGRLGQYPVNEVFSVGLIPDNEWAGSGLQPSNPLEGLWRITLENL
ncbi:hypothetical protein NIES4071_65260 [Calothrix sp. NIES-4071]|nr:hypothetical protein NIES4071_65260 [Calothrix sp. NIES-4071]BAZ60830.1 hypothetical protein NIES4105_65220 [Calothrix sp. NIES-4105]